MAEKNKPQTSPAGIAGWVCINKPSNKFKVQGEYSIKLILPPDVAAPMQEAFRNAAEEARAEFLKKEPKKAAVINKYNLHVPGADVTDEAGAPTGDIVFQFKQTAVITPKDKSKKPFDVKIGIFDAKGKPMPSEVVVGRGSKVKIAYEVIPFKMDATKQVGVTLRLKAVQVLELVEYTGGGDATSYGFGTEDGYEAEESSTTAPEGGSGEDPSTEAPAKNGDF